MVKRKSSSPAEQSEENAPRTPVGKSSRGNARNRADGDSGAESSQRPLCETCGQVHGRCAGHTKHGPNAGKPCGANPRAGALVCIKHGGNHPGQKKAAKQRLLELVDPALAVLHAVLTNPKTEDAVKVRASVAILDRTGFRPGLVVEVDPGDKWSKLLDAAVMRDNRSLGGGGNNPELVAAAAQQFAVDAQADAWRAFDDEEAAEYESRPSFRDENTITGEVVQSRYDVPVDRAPDDPPRYADGAPRGDD